jgi:purine-binding chemotaxis protein CheW
VAVAVLEQQAVVFVLSAQRYGIDLAAVDRVLNVVEITILPQAPHVVVGVINLHGRILPVVDLRRRFGLPERAAALRDQLLLARTRRRVVALLADQVLGVAVYDAATQRVAAAEILPGLSQVDGIVKLDDGLLLISDLERLLSLDEEARLDEALARS